MATGELYLTDVDIDNSGVYTCRVSSPSGATSSASTDVNVGFPPEFLEQSWEQIDFVLNAEAYFSCLAAGEPQPTVSRQSMSACFEPIVSSLGCRDLVLFV